MNDTPMRVCVACACMLALASLASAEGIEVMKHQAGVDFLELAGRGGLARFLANDPRCRKLHKPKPPKPEAEASVESEGAAGDVNQDAMSNWQQLNVIVCGPEGCEGKGVHGHPAPPRPQPTAVVIAEPHERPDRVKSIVAGVAFGAAMGAAAGVVIGVIAASSICGIAFGGPIGMAAGALIGGLIAWLAT